MMPNVVGGNQSRSEVDPQADMHRIEFFGILLCQPAVGFPSATIDQRVSDSIGMAQRIRATSFRKGIGNRPLHLMVTQRPHRRLFASTVNRPEPR